MKVLTVLMCHLFFSFPLWAEVVLDDTMGEDVKISVEHETIESVLHFYFEHFHTTATFPDLIAKDSFSASVRGKNISEATQHLFRKYNLALIEGKGGTIAHITLLPVFDGSEKDVDLGKMHYVGEVEKNHKGFDKSFVDHRRSSLWGGAYQQPHAGSSYSPALRHGGLRQGRVSSMPSRQLQSPSLSHHHW